MFKKATSSILEGIKNKMQKIDDSNAKVDDSDEEFLGLDDGFENLNVPKNQKDQQNNNFEAAKQKEDVSVKRNFNAEMEEIEKAMNSDLSSKQIEDEDEEIEEIEEVEENEDLEDENISENLEEEELEDLEDLEELKEIEESDDSSKEDDLEEEFDDLEETEESQNKENEQLENHDDFTQPEDEDKDDEEQEDEELHEESNNEIHEIEGDFHDFDLDVEDDVIQKPVSQEKFFDEKNDEVNEELKDEEIAIKDDGFSDLDEEDHEKESDFEMKDVPISEKELLDQKSSSKTIKQEEKLQDKKSASDNFFGEFNEKEEIEVALEDEFDDGEDIIFDSDEVVQKTDVKNSNFFGDADSQVNKFEKPKDIEKKKINEQSEEEIANILKNTGVEESLSVENIEDISDQEIDLSFDDLNQSNFNKMSAKLNNEGIGISSALLSEQTIKKSSDFIKNIMNNIGKVDGSGSAKFNHGVTVEEMVAIMLQPKLEEWLNNHLPEIVEKVVREEVKKILPNN